jgi:hypothetical protein
MLLVPFFILVGTSVGAAVQSMLRHPPPQRAAREHQLMQSAASRRERPSMHETPSRRLKPSIQLMTRTYAGDRKDMARLLSNLRMFVDLRAPDALLSGYTIVLDGEKPSDRAYGARAHGSHKL